jgi:hypothetical protein
MKDAIKIKGVINLKLIRKGELIEEREVVNTITKTGLAELANLAGNVTSPVAFTYLELGIGTTASTSDDTALESKITDTGLERASATVSRQTTTASNDTLQLLKQWTATGAKAVTECGAFNDASAGTMLGRQVFSVINTVSGDTLQLTYKFIFA